MGHRSVHTVPENEQQSLALSRTVSVLRLSSSRLLFACIHIRALFWCGWMLVFDFLYLFRMVGRPSSMRVRTATRPALSCLSLRRPTWSIRTMYVTASVPSNEWKREWNWACWCVSRLVGGCNLSWIYPELLLAVSYDLFLS